MFRHADLPDWKKMLRALEGIALKDYLTSEDNIRDRIFDYVEDVLISLSYLPPETAEQERMILDTAEGGMEVYGFKLQDEIDMQTYGRIIDDINYSRALSEGSS